MSKILTVVLLGAVGLGTGCAASIEGDTREAHDQAPAAQLYAERKLSAELFGCEGTRVALQTRNGKNYLTAVLGGGWSTMANATKVGKAETFKVYDLGSERVAFQASNGNYLVADATGVLLNANASSIGAGSTFKVTWSKNGDWLYLRSNQNKYVTAEGGGGGVANAGWPSAGDNQGWKAICVEGDGSDVSSPGMGGPTTGGSDGDFPGGKPGLGG